MYGRTFTAWIVRRLHALHLVDDRVSRPRLPAPLLCIIVCRSHTCKCTAYITGAISNLLSEQLQRLTLLSASM